MSNLYYVRISTLDVGCFEKHLTNNGSTFKRLSVDFNDTTMYSVRMNTAQELALRLSFPIHGCLNFKDTLDRLIPGK